MHLVPQADGSDLNTALRLVSQRARVLTQGTGAAIALAHKGSMICRASVGANAPAPGGRLDLTSGFSGECVRTGKVLRCDDSETDPRVDVASCRRLGIRSILAAPIKFKGGIVGLLEVFSSQPFAFDEGDVAVVERLAQTALLTPPAFKTTPPPKLLVELEPAHRVFFRNLADVLRSPQTAPLKLTSSPARFWPDVFVPSRLPWERFLQSLLLHVIVVATLGSFLEFWLSQRHPVYHRAFDKSDVIYYLPSDYPPGLGRGGVPSPMPKRGRSAFAKQPVISVPREREQRRDAIIKPPDIRLKHDLRLLHLVPWSSVAPPVPLSATTPRRLSTPTALVAAVAPPPDVSALSRSRIPTAPRAAVIEPPPSMHQSIRQIGDISIGHLRVVAPAPQMPLHEQGTISARAQAALGGAETSVVPPPPSVNGAGSPGRQGMSSPAAAMQVVPPPPLVRGAGNSGRGTLGGAATSVVPPPPSVNGAGNPGRQGVNSLSLTAMQVVPPPPLVRGAGYSGRETLGGAGTSVVPPPPSVNGAGNPGRQGVNSLSRAAMQVVPPPPLVRGVGNYSRGAAGNSSSGTAGGAATSVVPPPPSVNGSGNPGRQDMNALPLAAMHVAPPPTVVQRARDGARGGGLTAPDIPPPGVQSPGEVIADSQGTFGDTKELSVSFVGLAVALPSSSYFASHEVFIAEERLNRHQSRLIKLVYQFLPYQPRLSDYGPNYPAVNKLRATRDPSCDETLMQVTSWVNTPGSPQADRLRLDSKYFNQQESTLECYRTTADDYRRARARQHR
jgi:GAF domain-containing protein